MRKRRSPGRGARSRSSTLGAATTMALVAVSAGAALLSGCFSLKEPPCAFSCVAPAHRCPESYTCGDDGLCHRAGATGICGLTSPFDAGDEAGAEDDAAPGADAGASEAGD